MHGFLGLCYSLYSPLCVYVCTCLCACVEVREWPWPALQVFALFSEDKSLPELAFRLGQQSANLRVLPVYTLHPKLLG